jgi:hypothetical protein
MFIYVLPPLVGVLQESVGRSAVSLPNFDCGDEFYAEFLVA